MKAGAAHMKSFGHEKATNEFYSLIDRLQKCWEKKYPNRKWADDIYYSIAFEWLGKEEELKDRIEKLESEKP